eukprot:CAMPEP_0177729572 /NCGR_PEP_ID=MMETSP0484_2-20121128/21509_1 /TAXON_ID=354590 /ORGANISM="Rhodomonas lens, Strain RHODO" /LENGTH=133 /DNA_ID=CAMNT_0019242467 /DNA_START=1 /DNA_END=402 /DNA_ORIENTATION=+
MVLAVGHHQAALPIQAHAPRTVEGCSLEAPVLSARYPRPDEGDDEAVGGDAAESVVLGVGHEDVPRRIAAQEARLVERCNQSGAVTAPSLAGARDSSDLASRKVNSADAMALPLGDDEGVGARVPRQPVRKRQ